MTTARRTWLRPTWSARPQRVHIRQRGERLLELVAEALELGRQRQRLAERLERLVGREPGAEGCDLEQHAAGLAEVDRQEPEAVDDRRGMHANLPYTFPPRLVVLHRRSPGHVVDGAGAGEPTLGRRRVVRDPAAALVADDGPGVVAAGLEAEPLLEELAAALRGGAVGADALEPLEPVLLRDLRMVGRQRRVGRVGDHQLQPEPFGILEAQAPAVALRRSTFDPKPLGPELQRRVRSDAEPRGRDHPVARAAAGRARIFEERDVGAGRAVLVRVEEVVDRRVVLVDGLLDHPQPEYPDVEVDVARSVTGDAGDVVDPFDLHTKTLSSGD